MDEQLYRKFYDVEEKHWWFRARQRIVLHLIERVINLTATARILDVGCGTGGFLKGLQQRYDAWGIDSSELAIELCRKRGLKNVVCATIDDFCAREERFEMITLLDVVEHVEEDVAFMKSAARLTMPEGWVLVTTPAFPWLWSAHDDLNHHKRRYTREELSAKLVSAGLRPIYISYFNSFLFPLAFAERMSARFRRRGPSPGLDLPRPWINRTMERVFASEARMLGRVRFPVGLSLVAIARRA